MMTWIILFFQELLYADLIFLIAELVIIYSLIHTFVFAITTGRRLERVIDKGESPMNKADWLNIYRGHWRFLIWLDILRAFGVFVPIFIFFSVVKAPIRALDAYTAAGSIHHQIVEEGIFLVGVAAFHRLVLVCLIWIAFFAFRFVFRKRIRNLRLRFPGIKLYGLH